MGEPTVEVTVEVPEVEPEEAPPVVVVEQPEGISDADLDELSQLRAYKAEREAADAAAAQATADEALALAEFAAEEASQANVNAIEALVEAEAAAETSFEPDPVIVEPDLPPKIEHAWFRNFGGRS